MNKDEFISLVYSYNKQPGEFTKDEIIEIGLAHRDVEPKCDRNWELVKKLVGWNGTKDSLRAFVFHNITNPNCDFEQKEENIKKKKEEVDELVKEREELLKQQQRVRDEWSAYRRVVREDARVEAIKTLIVNEVGKLQKFKPIDFKETSKQDITKEGVLLISDLHIGVDCDNFYNRYNIEIAKKRLAKLVNDTLKYCKLNNVYRLNIINLGDMIHGIIHTSARIEQEVDVVNQVIVASELLAQCLNQLQSAAREVTYRSVVDNHSRISPNKEESIENENFSRLIDWYLKERLKGSNIIFKDDNIDIGIGKFTLLNGKKVMFSHGHNNTINSAFQQFIGASKEFIDYVLMGHYHSEKSKSFNSFKVIVNGSIVGTEQYALSKNLFSAPSQTLLIFDGFNMQNISIDLSINE